MAVKGELCTDELGINGWVQSDARSCQQAVFSWTLENNEVGVTSIVVERTLYKSPDLGSKTAKSIVNNYVLWLRNVNFISKIAKYGLKYVFWVNIQGMKKCWNSGFEKAWFLKL